MIADSGSATQNGQSASLVSSAVVIAPMNMKPAWPNEIRPVIPSSHMLTAIITLMRDQDHHVQEVGVAGSRTSRQRRQQRRPSERNASPTAHLGVTS